MPGSDCKDMDQVKELQCKECAPTLLCFKYTALPCPDDGSAPPGLTSCDDTSGGPQPIVDITVSNGMQVFFSKTVSNGEDFCVENSGDELPAELFVFINAPMGGNTPETLQVSTIDSTCQGDGLGLLQEYGALELVHFKNCNGDFNCLVPVIYEFSVTNVGSTPATITSLEGSYNGVSQDLLVGVPAYDLYLTEGKTFLLTKTSVVDGCGIENRVKSSVKANGEDKSYCNAYSELYFGTQSGSTPSGGGTDYPSSIPSDVPSPSPRPTKSIKQGSPNQGPTKRPHKPY